MSEVGTHPTFAEIQRSGPVSSPTLRTGVLGTVFRDTTSSYKFFWLLAIIDLLPEFDRPLPTARLVQAMIIRAWAAVVLFRLSLGKVDRLQDCVRALHASSGLQARTSATRLFRTLDTWPALHDWVKELARFVPGRFLGSWFPQAARATPYDRRGSRELVAVSDRAFGRADSGPYRLIETHNGALVELAPGWRDWLEANRALVLGFAEQQLTRYLQARNPSVPGIVNKLDLPRRRSLGSVRAWWAEIIAHDGQTALADIFSGEMLDDRFEVDHFLPWSFVVHDEFWNLAPTVPAVNRNKSDHLPALDLYLPRLAALHAGILRRPSLRRGLAQTYAEFLGVDPSQLIGLTPQWIEDRYQQVVRPLAQIAANQGFPTDWRNVPTSSDTRKFVTEGGGKTMNLLASPKYKMKGET